jgi:4-amino-4-deoxy-L-arabinose transferase-like glycosyltransferase
MITLGSMVLVPPLVMLLVVFLVTSNPRLRVGSIWPTIALAAFATVAVVWYLVVTFHRSYQPTIIEIRDGRLIVRDESTFNDWPIDRITSIRAESRNLGPSQYNYGQRPGNLMNLVPQPHLEISVTGRDVSRVLYQYSMPELEQIAKALRDELDK